jgi:hypothetical protein
VLAGKLERRLSLGSGESPEAKWTTFRYTLKKKKKTPNRKHAAVWTDGEMFAEVAQHVSIWPFFSLCLLKTSL